jgi:hypothetical protein
MLHGVRSGVQAASCGVMCSSWLCHHLQFMNHISHAKNKLRLLSLCVLQLFDCVEHRCRVGGVEIDRRLLQRSIQLFERHGKDFLRILWVVRVLLGVFFVELWREILLLRLASKRLETSQSIWGIASILCGGREDEREQLAVFWRK